MLVAFGSASEDLTEIGVWGKGLIRSISVIALAGGYLGWAWTSFRYTAQKRTSQLYRDQAEMSGRALDWLQEQDRKAELSIYVLKSHIREAARVNELLRRQVAELQKDNNLGEREQRASRDKINRLKRNRGGKE